MLLIHLSNSVGEVDPNFPVRFGLSHTGNCLLLPANRPVIPPHVDSFHLKTAANRQDDVGIVSSLLHKQTSVGVELQLAECLFHLLGVR